MATNIVYESKICVLSLSVLKFWRIRNTIFVTSPLLELSFRLKQKNGFETISFITFYDHTPYQISKTFCKYQIYQILDLKYLYLSDIDKIWRIDEDSTKSDRSNKVDKSDNIRCYGGSNLETFLMKAWAKRSFPLFWNL